MVAMQLKLISKCYITFIRFGCRLHHASGGSMKSCRRGRSDVTSATRRARVILEEGTDGSQTKSGGKCELITSFGCHLFFSQRQMLEQLPALPSTVNSACRQRAPSFIHLHHHHGQIKKINKPAFFRFPTSAKVSPFKVRSRRSRWWSSSINIFYDEVDDDSIATTNQYYHYYRRRLRRRLCLRRREQA